MSWVAEVETLAREYLVAKRAVVDAGFASEIGWQAMASSTEVTARLFVEEAAWVVMSAGLAERAVRRRFPLMSRALFEFDLPRIIREPTCRDAAFTVFAHERKVDAILGIAAWAHDAGDDVIRDLVQMRDESSLMQLPYIGPATVRHLLKNLGAPVPKPDRHLTRFASHYGCSVDELCQALAARLGEPIAVVDIVLWRWSALHGNECRKPCRGMPSSPHSLKPRLTHHNNEVHAIRNG